MRKHLAMLASCVMLLGNAALLPVSAADYTEGTYERLTYQNYGDHIVITGCTAPENGSAFEVIVPEEIDGVPVTIIGERAFSHQEQLYSITLPDSVTTIETKAFQACLVWTLTLSENLTTIGASAFNKCTSLHTLDILDSVVSIGENAFSYSGLTSITLPDSISVIPEGAFHGSSLKTIEFPEALTTIEERAFSGTKIESLTIPDTVTTLGPGVFYNTSSLTSVDLPAGLTVIPSSLFSDCSNLTTVSIPDAVTQIGTSAFYRCTSLTDIYYAGTEEAWSAVTINYQNDPLSTAAIHYEADAAAPANFGDVNLDGTINIADVILLNRAILNDVTLDGTQKTASDVNVDDTIDSTDSLLILKFIVELIDSF